MSRIDLQLDDFLTEKYRKYMSVDFIETDPVQIPHRFCEKEDVEIAGFLAATIAWGNRAMIIKNASRMVNLMDDAPYDFVQNAGTSDLNGLEKFVHRTFNGTDFKAFVGSLQIIYRQYGGLEQVFTEGFKQYGTIFGAIAHFRTVFTDGPFSARSQKHVPNVEKHSAAKRINMYLRWMVRKDAVDFGLWKGIPKSALMLPLDVHTGRVGRQLGLLSRKQDDWKAVEEITGSLRLFDPDDPVKYDYALFGIGAFEKDFF